MLTHSFYVVLACLLLALPARAQNVSEPPPTMSDVVYKGIVGKALDAVPMDPEERVNLQRTSTVVSSTLAGRSLSVWAGLSLSNPILLIAGMAWGIFSATKIETADARTIPHIQHAAAFAATESIEIFDVGQLQADQLMEPQSEVTPQIVPRTWRAAEN